jgi:hypothetical protein
MVLLTLGLPSLVIDVSPTGPGPTLPQALEQAKGQPNAVIRLKTGTYVVPQTLRIGKEHAGLTIEAAPGAKPVLIGGVRVTGWKVEPGLWVAPVSDAIAKAGSRLLAVNGVMQPRSRWPETGHLEHENVFDVPWMSTTGGGWKRKPTDDELTTMRYRPGDVGNWVDPMSAEVTVVHMWDESCVGIAGINPETREIRFSSPTGHPPGAFGVKKYIVWNTERGLTKPGQWFLDRRAKRLVYRPFPGSELFGTVVHLATLDRIFSIEGASGVTVRGLKLTVTNVPLKSAGFGAGDYDGALMATDAPDLRIERIQVSDVAGTGIRTWNCPRLQIRHCQVNRTGAGGVRAEGEGARVLDNTVRDVGLQYPSAIGIWAGQKGTQIAHNLIADTSYSAMIAGGEGTVIESNRIARAMKVLHDGAGIYVGFTKNVTLRGNWISEIPDTGGYGVSAYYLDEQAEDCLVEGNVSEGVVRPSQNHMARGNTLRNNLFLSDKELRLDFARCENYTLEQNVLACKGGIVFRLPKGGWKSFSGNLMDPGEGELGRKWLEQYSESQTERLPLADGNRVQPLRVQANRGLFRVSIPADRSFKVRTWDVRKAGPRRSGDR